MEESLKQKNIKLFQEWHEKNKESPENISWYSSKKVWWKCDAGHEWEAKVFSRFRKNSKCPFCSGRRACEENSLGKINPELVSEWHVKNIKTPFDYVSGSTFKAWWKCKNKHEWQSEIRNRTQRKHGCPFCSNMSVDEGNCVEKTHKHLMHEWHCNNKYKPNELVAGSAKIILWQCSKCSHEWCARVASRALEKKNCPICANYIKSITMSEKILNGWNSYKNSCLTGYFFSDKNNKKIFFRSSYEKKAFEILENDDEVANYKIEHIKIKYKHENKYRFYIPDILVEYVNGESQLIEIKPLKMFKIKGKKKLISKLKALSKYSKDNNMKKCLIWHEKHLGI